MSMLLYIKKYDLKQCLVNSGKNENMPFAQFS